jgi:hypothetical protein
MNHVLSLEAPDTLNKKIFRIVDMSVYNQNVPVECELLEVTLPGFATPATFSGISTGFMLNLTACDLEVQTQNCGSDYLDLPDGVYIIKYSLSPADIIYVEYNHLRTSCIMNAYLQQLCKVQLNDCAPGSEIEAKLKLLGEIRTYIDAAKAKVEICHEPQKGMELYTYAKKLLTKFDCSSCHR